ncbi:MAG: hypothetical protein AAF267_01170 [Deinococcota bacterium]
MSLFFRKDINRVMMLASTEINAISLTAIANQKSKALASREVDEPINLPVTSVKAPIPKKDMLLYSGLI